MAKQKGIIKLEGTIGDITFVKTKDGYLAKERTSVTANRIKGDPGFQRTRENNAEFARAAKGSKTLRRAFRNQLQLAKDGNVVARLTKEMMKVVKADATSTRGQRNITDGEAEMLQGFQFNSNAVLASTLFAQYVSAIDRTTGNATVNIPGFIPVNQVVAPDGATHFSLMAAAAEIDFEADVFTAVETGTGILPWDSTKLADIQLALALPALSKHPLFLIFGIQFHQLVNGVEYPLKNGIFNAFGIVNVSGI